MDSKEHIIHNRHEKWCLNVALPFCGKVIRHRAFRQPLIEHFSNSVSLGCFASTQEKIFHALKIYENRPLKDRGDERSPSMVILSHRQPDKLLKINGLFEPMGPSGLWVKGPLDFGTTFLVVTSRLPPDPRYDWLRMTTRVPKNAIEYERATVLIAGEKIDRMSREKVKESVMELMIDGKTPFDFKEELEQVKREFAEVMSAYGRVTTDLNELKEFKAQAEEQKKQADERVRKLEVENEELRRLLAQKE